MDELSVIAAALGDPLRLRILDLLAAGRCKPCSSPEHPDAPVWVCACDMAAELGGLASSKLAYHLSQLRAVGLLDEHRHGKWVYYSINEDALTRFTQALASRWARPLEPCCKSKGPAQVRMETAHRATRTVKSTGEAAKATGVASHRTAPRGSAK